MNKERNEKKYQSYLSGEKYARWTELNNKVGKKGKDAMTKEEHEEYVKLSKIRENLPKVKNLMDAQKELVELREAILDELSQIAALDKENKDIDKKNKQIGVDRRRLENELATLMKQREDIYKELKKDNLKPEERTALKRKIERIGEKIQENNNKFTANEEKVEQVFKDRASTTDLATMTKSKLVNKAVNLKIKIDVYNLYIVNLMQGKDLTEIKGIEAAKDWKDAKTRYRKELNSEVTKFTSSKEQRDRIRKLDEIKKEEEKDKTEKGTTGKGTVGDEIPKDETTGKGTAGDETPKDENHEPEENKLVPVPEWKQKHPRLAKFWDGFKNILPWNKKEEESKVNPDEKKPDEKKPDEKKPDEKKPDEKAVTENTARTSFLKEIRFFEETDISKIAENGVQETRKQYQHDVKVNAMEKLIENKKKAKGDDGGTIAVLEEKLRKMQEGEDR